MGAGRSRCSVFVLVLVGALLLAIGSDASGRGLGRGLGGGLPEDPRQATGILIDAVGAGNRAKSRFANTTTHDLTVSYGGHIFRLRSGSTKTVRLPATKPVGLRIVEKNPRGRGRGFRLHFAGEIDPSVARQLILLTGTRSGP